MEGQDHGWGHGSGSPSKPQRMEVCIPWWSHGKMPQYSIHVTTTAFVLTALGVTILLNMQLTQKKCMFRWKMSSLVHSKRTDISNTDGHVDQQTCLGKCWWRSSETRCLAQSLSNIKYIYSQDLFLTSYRFSLVQKVTLWKKIHVIYNFFLVRKIIAHIVTFVFYCIVIPATVLVPEVEIPKWGSVYIPTIITLLNAVGTPRYQSFQELCDPII
jgi:hypothetical protein